MIALEVQKRGSSGNNQQSELPGVEHVAADALSLCFFDFPSNKKVETQVNQNILVSNQASADQCRVP